MPSSQGFLVGSEMATAAAGGASLCLFPVPALPEHLEFVDRARPPGTHRVIVLVFGGKPPDGVDGRFVRVLFQPGELIADVAGDANRMLVFHEWICIPFREKYFAFTFRMRRLFSKNRDFGRYISSIRPYRASIELGV